MKMGFLRRLNLWRRELVSDMECIAWTVRSWEFRRGVAR